MFLMAVQQYQQPSHCFLFVKTDQLTALTTGQLVMKINTFTLEMREQWKWISMKMASCNEQHGYNASKIKATNKLKLIHLLNMSHLTYKKSSVLVCAKFPSCKDHRKSHVPWHHTKTNLTIVLWQSADELSHRINRCHTIPSWIMHESTNTLIHNSWCNRWK